MSITVTIDAETCIGTGNCVFNAPTVFEQDDSGTSQVLDLAGAPEQTIRFAASTCPVGAITVTERAEA